MPLFCSVGTHEIRFCEPQLKKPNIRNDCYRHKTDPVTFDGDCENNKGVLGYRNSSLSKLEVKDIGEDNLSSLQYPLLQVIGVPKHVFPLTTELNKTRFTRVELNLW